MVMGVCLQYGTKNNSAILNYVSNTHAHNRVVSGWAPSHVTAPPLIRHARGRLCSGASLATTVSPIMMEPASPSRCSLLKFVPPHISFSVWWCPRGPRPAGAIAFGLFMNEFDKTWFLSRLFYWLYICRPSDSFDLLFWRFCKYSWY